MITRFFITLFIATLCGHVAAQQSHCTYHYGGGQTCWGPGTTGPLNQGNRNVGQQTFTQQQVVIPRGVAVGQPFITQVGGAQQRCTLVDRALSAGAQGLLAGGIGYIAEKLLNRKDHQWSATLATGGMAAGATITCDPNIYDEGGRTTVSASSIQNQQPGNQTHWCVVNGRTIQVVPDQACPQETLTKSSKTNPVQKDGQTCAMLTKDGFVVRDFLSTDKNLNPLPSPVETGEECAAAQRRFAAS